jgi:hypothetical protein
MIISGPEDRHLVDDFQAEFDAMWNDPQISKSGDECRKLKDKLCDMIIQEHNKELEAQKKTVD